MKIPLRQYLDLLSNYLKPQKRKVMLLGVLLLLQLGLQLFNPQLLRYFIDNAVAGSPSELLVGAAGLFILIALINQMLSVANTYVSQNVGWSATNVLRAELAQHCLALDMPFHKARSPGELIERIDGDVTALANFFSQFVMLVLANALLLIGVLVVLWGEDWRVGLALTLFTLIALTTINHTRSIALPHNIASRQALAMLFGFLEERLAGLEDIRANGAGAYTATRFDRLQRDVYHKTVKAELVGSVNDLLSTGFFALAYVGALALGAWLFQSGGMGVGTIFLVMRYTQMLREPMQQLTRQMQDLQKASAGIVRIRELLSLRKQVRDGRGEQLPAGALSVEFQHLSFEYDDHMSASQPPSPATNGNPVSRATQDNGSDARVLHDLSFTLQSGKTLGLLGRTGSGKTTLTRLLLRLYDPTAGHIRLNGIEICATRLSELRRAIGMVTQEVQLFRATLRDNLTLFETDIADDDILQALVELGLWGWYASLPDGLDTQLAPGGGGLSAGEAQLLAFTRVLLRNPSLVILDEASARLDPATERLIERAVDRLLRDRTGIIIAHRLDTVQRADEIMILDDGRICEYGSRAQLASDHHSRFYHLLQTGLEEVLV